MYVWKTINGKEAWSRVCCLDDKLSRNHFYGRGLLFLVVVFVVGEPLVISLLAILVKVSCSLVVCLAACELGALVN